MIRRCLVLVATVAALVLRSDSGLNPQGAVLFSQDQPTLSGPFWSFGSLDCGWRLDATGPYSLQMGVAILDPGNSVVAQGNAQGQYSITATASYGLPSDASTGAYRCLVSATATGLEPEWSENAEGIYYYSNPNCNNPCRPGVNFSVPGGTTIFFDIGDIFVGSPPDFNDFKASMDAWVTALASVGRPVQIKPGGGGVHVFFDNSMIGTGNWALADWGPAQTLALNPDILSYPHAIRGLALHEIGHFLGLAHVPRSPGDQPCGLSSTAMIYGVTGSELQSSVLTAPVFTDKCSLSY
jgi:hypothetical protein